MNKNEHQEKGLSARGIINKLSYRDKNGKVKAEFWLLLIVLFALALRLYFYIGLNLNDDLVYVNLAREIVVGKFQPHGWIFAERLAINYPIALSFFLLGFNDFSASLYILLCSLGCVVTAFYLGRLLFDKKTGLLSAFLMSIIPIDVLYSTTIVPDIPVAFFTFLSVYLFFRGERTGNKYYRFYILSGIALGVAWLVKSLAILLVLFFLTYFIAEKLIKFDILCHKIKKTLFIRREYFFLMLGFLIVILLEGIFYLYWTGDFLQRFDTEIGIYTPDLRGVNTNLNYYPDVLFTRNDVYFNFFGFFFQIFILASAYLIWKGERNAVIMVLWVFSLLIYMQYGTMNPIEFTLIQRIWRFLTVITMPVVITIAYFMVRYRIKIITFSILIFLLVTSIYFISNSAFYMKGTMSDFRLIADYLEKAPTKTIYSDYDTIGKLNFLLGYEKEDMLKNVVTIENATQISDAYIIINASRGFVELADERNTLPEFMFGIPDNWTLVKTVEGFDFGAYSRYDPVIYHAP